MNTQTLEYIIAIAEEKSISRAADRLLVSQPAISRQLKRVEERLGTKLFLRERGEMILTDAGKIYVNGAPIPSKVFTSTHLRRSENSNNPENDRSLSSIIMRFCRISPSTSCLSFASSIRIQESAQSMAMPRSQRITSQMEWQISPSSRRGRQATRCSSSCPSEMKNSCLPCPPLTPQSPHLRNMGLISPCFEMSPLS